ncbi:odorant receptor 67d-like [Musca autumnalis]|uniref:odorant receptor 67d-like n=1 Tax=Musca autumnalis TaxID=221902 RepID=UPI003CED0C1E
MSSVKILFGPSERFEKIVRIMRFSAAICGIDLLRPNYRMNFITYTLFASITGYYLLVLRTIWLKFNDDFIIVVKATLTMGTAFQGVSKLYAFISNKKVIMEIYQLLSGIYRDFAKKGSEYAESLDVCLNKTVAALYGLMLSNILGYVGLVAVPYLVMFFTGQRYLIWEIIIPGLDIATDFGYFATIAIQSVLMIGYGFGLFCGDLVALLYLIQSFMFANIFEVKVQDFNDSLKTKAGKGTRVSKGISKTLKDIAQWQQLFTQYTLKCNDLFYYIITVQIITAFYSTILSIYFILTGSLPGAYAYISVTICALFMYCFLGTENEKANEQFTVIIYSIHWYELSVQEQKVVLQMLYLAQNPQIIDIAGVCPLSVSTALRISKMVYSASMMMVQFL